MADQGDFTSGDVLTAAELNAFSQVTILQDTISVPNVTNTTPAFTTELIDVGGWHASGSSNIVTPYDGVYTITANALNLGNARGLVNIFVGGSVVASTDGDIARDVSCTITTLVSAGVNINIQLFHSTGSTTTPLVTFSVELVRRT